MARLESMSERTPEQIRGLLEALIEHNYYAEDYELVWRVKGLGEGMAAGERKALGQVILERLGERPSVVDILLCGAVELPASVPRLIEILNCQEEANLSTRCLISVLGGYGDPAAFSAVERFLDSDQEQSALQSLGRMDFTRALFYVIRCADRDHLLDVCVSVLQQRRKEVGLTRLITEVRRYGEGSRKPLGDPLRRILGRKQGLHSPFTPEECAAMLGAVR